MNLIGDFWNRNKNENYYHDNVSFETAVEYLKTLDGKQKTEILLENGDTSLSIAGGNFGLYIVNYYDNEGNFYLLMKNADESSEVSLICGGQLAVFNRKNCFDISCVIDVVKAYFHSEDILKRFTWSS